jgi:hypothetical protein
MKMLFFDDSQNNTRPDLIEFGYPRDENSRLEISIEAIRRSGIIYGETLLYGATKLAGGAQDVKQQVAQIDKTQRATTTRARVTFLGIVPSKAISLYTTISG